MWRFFLLALSCHINVATCINKATFYTKLSVACIEANISKTQDCPYSRKIGKKWNPTGVSKRTGLKTFSTKQYTCSYKLIEREYTCNTRPSCVKTTYTYALPLPPTNVTACGKQFSISTTCNANGLQNLKTVYTECFKKGSRSFCKIDFQPCESFQWTKMLQCYVPCKTSSFDGVAERLVKKCVSQDGKDVDEENCSGSLTTSETSRLCLQRSTIAREITMCNESNDTLTVNATSYYSITVVPTTTIFTNATQSDIQYTTDPPPRSTASTAVNNTVTTETTHFVDSSAVISTTHVPPENVTDYDSSSETRSKNGFAVSPRILLPVSDAAGTNDSLGPVFPDVAGDGNKPYTFDVLPVASGAGAGLLFIFVMALIIVLLVRRRDHKSSGVTSILSSTSSYRTKSRRNPVVDSGSFRIATWIRERPSLPNGGSLSPSESVVSDAEYWKVGESYDDLTARYVQDRRDSKTSEVPDVVRTVSQNTRQENIYDEVYSSDDEDAPTTSNRTSTPIVTRPPSSSNQSQTDRPLHDVSSDKNVMYAAVQKSRKRDQMRKRSSATSMGAARRRIASQHSVTNLNGTQLRDGVLQIEFDDEQGVKCKLSESDTYIDLKEDGQPPVF